MFSWTAAHGGTRWGMNRLEGGVLSAKEKRYGAGGPFVVEKKERGIK